MSKRKSRQVTTDGEPVFCSCSCCPTHPLHGSASRLAVEVPCRPPKSLHEGLCAAGALEAAHEAGVRENAWLDGAPGPLYPPIPA